MENIRNKIDFALVFTATKCNPNGDPLDGNRPRTDIDGFGEVSDVCLKRKIRNYVEAVKEGEAGYRIYIKDNVPLNRSDLEAYNKFGVDPKKDKPKKDEALDEKIRDFMCSEFYDIRTFGAVMTTFVKDHPCSDRDGG